MELSPRGQPVGTKEACPSTGGTITHTKRGIIHQGGQSYGGKDPDNKHED